MNEASQGYGNVPPPTAGLPPSVPPNPPYSQVVAAAPGPDRRALTISGAVLGAIVLMVGAVALGGEPAKFVTVGFQIIPLALLAALAYAGRKNSTAAGFTYLTLAALGVLMLGFVFLITLSIYLNMDLQAAPSERLKPGAGSALLWTTLLLMLTSAVAGLMLLRPVRVSLARIIPIDPDNFVHKIALCILTLIM